MEKIPRLIHDRCRSVAVNTLVLIVVIGVIGCCWWSGGSSTNEAAPLVDIRTPPVVESFDLGKGIMLRMIKVKAGRFKMGCSSPLYDFLSSNNDEKRHWVTLTQDYWLGETEITQGQWMAVMGDIPDLIKSKETHHKFHGIGDDYPVYDVSWIMAMEFCDKLNQMHGEKLPDGYRFSLPTEAQWEYACRAGTTTELNNGKNISLLSFGNGDLDEVAWYCNNSKYDAHPVALKRPNAWGFYDMHGNVWEWCSDWYDEGYGCYNEDAIDPQGLPKGEKRVLRGLYFGNKAGAFDSSRRLDVLPSNHDERLGFRVALVPKHR